MTTQLPERTNGSSAVQKPAQAPTLFGREAGRNFEALRQWMDSFFGSPAFPAVAFETEPAVNLYEKDGGYTLECAVPGYKKDDIAVEARGDQVTISGSYSQEKSEEKNQYHRREWRKGSFLRNVLLPQEIDPEQVSAKLENGMLTVSLRPTKVLKSKTIPIASA